MNNKKFVEKLEKYLKRQFGVTISNASKRQVYEALMSTVRDDLSEKKFSYEQELKKTKQKRAYYMSMEFLVGRTLRNNLFNLGLEKDIKEYLDGNNFNLDEIYDIEPDPGLGNGGLGRLASCYLDALTSSDYPVTGFSILYEYGIFKQVINNGWQQEFPDYWLDLGKYGLVYRNDEEVEVRFYGRVEEKLTENGFVVEHKDYTSIQAEPYDLLISGYKTDTVNTLRLWEAKAKTGFNMKLFERGEYSKSSEAEAIASSISKLLYPADSTNEGKELRIKQQYFFISASLQQLLKNHYNEFGTLENLSDHVALHINDTHPAMGVPELMRLLLDEYGYSWDKAWDITTKTFAYTNHTIMAEALEKWSVDLFRPLLPRIYSIIEEINKRFCQWVIDQGKDYTLAETAIIYDNQIRMANLSIVGSHHVNGVSKLHSEILVESTFKAFCELYPTRFGNVTNGIAHRRWLGQANPELADYLEELIGNDFIKTYCKVTPVSVVLPFKIGEIFRMYCYGKLIGNVLRGMVIVLFDRFMDTAALVTVIFLSWILNSEGAVKPDLLMCFLLLFLIFTFAIYFVYPGIKKIWIKSLLKSKATHNKIAVLSTLNKISDIYIEIENVSKGRGVVLYILSIIAWVVEIGSLYLMGAVSMEGQINSSVFEYLRSAIRDNQSLELQRFIAVTILFLIGIYAILKIVDVFSKKGNKL